MKHAPCSLCHFCAQADMENHGSVCVWYNVYILQDDVHLGEAPLRRVCAQDNNNFVWRMANVGILDYAKWKQSVDIIPATRRRANIAIIVSIVSLVATIVSKFL